MEDKFKYTYSAPNAEEKKEILKIQSQYLPKENNSKDENLSRLKELDSLAKRPAKILSAVMGVIGFFCFGGGMAMSMETPHVLWGAVLGVAGIILMAFAYPVYTKIFLKQKTKYSAEILKISQNLLQENNQDNVNLDIKQADDEV